ncbi:MAG: cobamide remodeling phosphodiesterase CbiR [Thermoproteota archaeon]
MNKDVADLRLGATALSLETLTSELKLELGLASLDYISIVRKVVENGFKHVELTADLYYLLPSSFSRESIDEFRLIRSKDITFSVHLPICSIELDSPVEKVRKASVEAVVKPVEEIEELKPLMYVLHIAGPLAAEVNRMDLSPAIKQFLFEALAHNASRSVEEVVSLMHNMGIPPRRIALESMEFPFDKTIEIAEEFDTSICIDTGHVLAGYSGNVPLEDALRHSSGRLGEIHLHDAYKRREGSHTVIRDHLFLGAGNMNVPGFLKTLGETGFKGPVVFELGLKDAKDSLERLSCFLKGRFFSESILLTFSRQRLTHSSGA